MSNLLSNAQLFYTYDFWTRLFNLVPNILEFLTTFFGSPVASVHSFLTGGHLMFPLGTILSSATTESLYYSLPNIPVISQIFDLSFTVAEWVFELVYGLLPKIINVFLPYTFPQPFDVITCPYWLYLLLFLPVCIILFKAVFSLVSIIVKLLRDIFTMQS